jgi:hypothetical protein
MLLHILVAAAVAALLLLILLRPAAPVMVRLLSHRNLSAIRAVTRDYVQGVVSLEAGAAHLKSLLDKESRYAQWLEGPTGASRAEITSLAPEGVRPDDPRIAVLWDRASELFHGPERYQQIQVRLWGRPENRDGPGAPRPGEGAV